MDDLFEALATRNLTKQKEEDLAIKIHIFCKCASITGTVSSQKLRSLSKSVRDRLKTEIDQF